MMSQYKWVNYGDTRLFEVGIEQDGMLRFVPVKLSGSVNAGDIR